MSNAASATQLYEAISARNDGRALQIIEEVWSWYSKRKIVDDPAAAKRVQGTLALDLSASVRFNWENLNIPDDQGRTHLHVAALRSLPHICNALVQRFMVDCNAQDNLGWTPLLYAAASKSLETVQALLKAGAKLSLKIPAKDGDLPLHVAVRKQNEMHFSVLLDAGAEIDAKTKGGFTALHLAAEFITEREDFDVLWYRADETVRLQSSDTGRTIIHCAAAGNNYKLIERLISQGQRCDVQDKAGQTPLHIACACNAGPAAGALLGAGVDPNTQDTNGQTALHVAARVGALRIAQLLIRRGAAVDVCDARGWTPLFEAVTANQLATVRGLLAQGAQVNVRANDGDLVSHAAARIAAAIPHLTVSQAGQLEEVMRDLVHAQLNVNAVGAGGDTLLSISARVGSVRLLRMMMQFGAVLETSKMPPVPVPAIHCAAARADVEFLRTVIELGADPSVCDTTGRPALLAAMEAGREANMLCLLENGTCFALTSRIWSVGLFLTYLFRAESQAPTRMQCVQTTGRFFIKPSCSTNRHGALFFLTDPCFKLC